MGDRSPIDRPANTDKNFRFAAIITAHQDSRLVPPLVDSLLKQTYDQLGIFVVADDCPPGVLNFSDPRVRVIYPQPALHAKIRSIRLAIDQFDQAYDALVIFDSDNLVHPAYFEYLNKYFQRGFRAVQTHMLSKNTESTYARLDSIGHIYNTFLEREMRMELGLSACILGLGVAIDIRLYQDIMYENTLGGFDKKLQADLVKRIPQLAFAREAIVFDEKVEDGQTLEKQRTRWLYAYFHYLPVNWDIFLTGIRRLDPKLMYFGFILLRPPLFIVVVAAFLAAAINLFFLPLYSLLWLGVLFVFALSFALIIATQSRQKGMTRALFHVPLVIFRQIRAMLRMNKAAKGFLKTEHSRVVYIDELLKDELA
jgi:cellulose synthase/poly-beta-1,6-N-acetylglucosamine synthase-like glycosyltransferase